MKKWEYKVERAFDVNELEGQLNELGKDGWEALSFQNATHSIVIVLKREKVDG